MRTAERLKKLQQWVERELCRGHMLKTAAPNGDFSKIVRQEPPCYIAWAPTRPDKTGYFPQNARNDVPSIKLMPDVGYARNMEIERYDQYNGIRRPGDLGQTLVVNMLFSVYEPGVRMPGFIDDLEQGRPMNMELLREGTEEGLFTLLDWMDEAVAKLLGAETIPGTDLTVHKANISYKLYDESGMVVDKRPEFYGFIQVEFGGYATAAVNHEIDDILNK